MNEQQRFLLISNKKSIGDDLRSEDVFSYLQSKFVLDVDEVELIKYEKTSRRRTEKLLKILPDKGSAAFIHFHAALIDAGYEHLAELLTSGIPTEHVSTGSGDEDEETLSVEEILRYGGVPQRPAVHAKRPKEIEKLRDALYKLKESDGWVLLHGMAGSGKTVLASEVLADRELLSDCFPGGVFWVAIGMVDAARLLMKMQNLCAWLDADRVHQAPRNLEEARDRIRILFAHEHPRSLLVLDDLWTKEDARFFDVRARTLVTSRNDFITDNITGTVIKVHIEEGLTEDQSKAVLSQWTHLDPHSLPNEAVGLIKACQGSPLAISMIGALLKGHSNRWEYYLKQLQDHKVIKLKSKLAYEHPTLCDAIAISVKNLEDDIRKKYECFAVFEEDSRIPGKVLGLLWNDNEIEVEDTMDELISRSLAKRHPRTIDVPYETYSVHDLQLDYLKETRGLIPGTSTLSDMHKELVQKYLDLYGSFSSVPDDGYIYWNIINHLVEAGMVDEAVKLLLSFEWIEAKLKATGAPDLINNYHKIIKLVSEETRIELKDYVHFIGINSYLLSTPGRHEYDLIQLALAQPFATRVHMKAKCIATHGACKNKFYVGWCNEPDGSSETCLLTVKQHSGPVHCCHWAQDGTDRIVSCGGDAVIKIWNSCTGQGLHSLSGHTDSVHCCQFSPDTKKIVSASADKTIKVWDTTTGRPILTFKGHNGDVYCCTFSPVDNSIIATCSSDATIKIWDITSDVLLRTLYGHEDTVNWCCFSPDGTRIASASNDHTVKIWNVADAKCIVSCGGDKDFVSFCVYHPSGKIILATSQNFLQFFNAETGASFKTIQTMCSVLSIAFSPDGKYAVGTHADSTAQLWNIEAEVCMGIFRGHSGWLHSVCYSPDGQRIVTASADETCKIWKVEPVEDRAVKLRKVFDVKFKGVLGSIIVAANSNHEIQVIDGTNGNLRGRSLQLGSKITACKFAGNGDIIIVGLTTGHIKLLNAETCEEIATFIGQFGAISDCAVSDDGNTFVTCSEDHTVKVWDLQKRVLNVDCIGHTDQVTKCAFYNHQEKIVTSSYDGTIKVWKLENGQCLFTCHHNDNNTVLSCAVSPDDTLIVSTSAGSTAKLWNCETGELMHTLSGHNDCVRCASFSPDSAVVATGSDDSTIKIWDTKTGENLTTCEGHRVWVTDVRFSSDGNLFVSVSGDIKWWKRDGSPLQTFLVRGNYLRQIKVSDDFKKFITIDDTGQLYILDAV